MVSLILHIFVHPNWTHGTIARTIAERCKIVFVEKSGLRTSDSWEALVHTFPTQDLLW